MNICGALSNVNLQGHPNWLNLGGVVHGFDSQTVLSLVNHNPAPVNLLSVSLRCDVAEFLSVTLRAENASGVLSATYAVPGQSRGGCCLHLQARARAPCCMFALHLRCLFPTPHVSSRLVMASLGNGFLCFLPLNLSVPSFVFFLCERQNWVTRLASVSLCPLALSSGWRCTTASQSRPAVRYTARGTHRVSNAVILVFASGKRLSPSTPFFLHNFHPWCH